MIERAVAFSHLDLSSPASRQKMHSVQIFKDIKKLLPNEAFTVEAGDTDSKVIKKLDDKESFATLGLHLGFSAKLRIWQVSAYKMEPRSGFIS